VTASCTRTAYAHLLINQRQAAAAAAAAAFAARIHEPRTQTPARYAAIARLTEDAGREVDGRSLIVLLCVCVCVFEDAPGPK